MYFIKTIIKTSLVILFILLFLGLGLFYNQEKKTLAQEEIIFGCGDEIPLGEAIDEAVDFGVQIDANIQAILSASTTQVNSAESLYEIPDECKAVNCSTVCNIFNNSYQDPCCWEIDVCQPCTVTEQLCEVNDCTGTPCPDTSSLMGQIESSYNFINAAKGAIEGLITNKRPEIVDEDGSLLEITRDELEKCVVSDDKLVDWEIIGEILLPCDEAKYERLLEEGEICYPNNFFCCQAE
ncbi:hypothetical protein ACFL06_00300 [Patescibacteria group bacterium]